MYLWNKPYLIVAWHSLYGIQFSGALTSSWYLFLSRFVSYVSVGLGLGVMLSSKWVQKYSFFHILEELVYNCYSYCIPYTLVDLAESSVSLEELLCEEANPTHNYLMTIGLFRLSTSFCFWLRDLFAHHVQLP